MLFDPSHHSLLEVQAARRFYQATRQLGAFEDVLSHLLGDYDQASLLTMEMIWALDDTLAITADVRDPMVVRRLQGRLGRQLTMAMGSLLRDYGMTLSTPITLMQDLVGHVLVRGEHAERAAIEGLLNRSGLLTEAVGILLKAQAQLTTEDEAGDLPSLTLADQGSGITIVSPSTDTDVPVRVGRS